MTDAAVPPVERVDPIAVEVIHHALLAGALEMKADLQRTAHSPIINDGLDFSVALFNERGETVAQAPGLPDFLCDIPTAIHSVAHDIGGFGRFRPGDVYLTNDPYLNTNHTNDVNVIKPIFHGGQLCGFAGARAHWHDIGGASGAGGYNSTEIFQEGLILRSIRLYDAGVLDVDVMRIVRENNRLPEAVEGDIRAQVASCRVGEDRYLDVINRYGVDVVQAAIAHIFANGESAALAALRTIPEGTYTAESCLDHDGVDLDRPLRVRATVHVRQDAMEVDLAGSSPHCRGPFNSNPNTTTSTCRMIFKMLTTPTEPANEGHFRPLTVRIPSGSLFDAHRPSPTKLGFVAHHTLLDVIKTALARAIPDRVNAHDYGKCTPTHTKGWDGDRYFIMPDTEGGGWGGKSSGDGMSASLWGDVRVVPVEVIESKYPVQVLRYSLRPDSGGPGRYRGGLGIIKEYLMLVDVRLNAALDRQIHPPQGILGGRHALHNQVVVTAPDGTTVRLPSKVTDYPIPAGGIVSLQTGGGGGFGEPRERDRWQIEADLVDGFISRAHASAAYGLSSAEGAAVATASQDPGTGVSRYSGE
jgi:N-methylhydantoinase B